MLPRQTLAPDSFTEVLMRLCSLLVLLALGFVFAPALPGCVSAATADDRTPPTEETRNHEERNHEATSSTPSIDLLADATLSAWRDVWDRAHRSTKAEHFQMQDGVLHVTGGTNGAIVTAAEYDAFELRFAWRWPVETGTEPGNAGLMFHTQPSRGALFVTGMEVQLRHGEAGDLYGVGIAAMGRDRARQQGNLMPRNPTPDAEQPAIELPPGEWNQALVVCLGDRVRVQINGHWVNEALRLGRDRGRIAIQAEDADIWFRNVRLQPIASDP